MGISFSLKEKEASFLFSFSPKEVAPTGPGSGGGLKMVLVDADGEGGGGQGRGKQEGSSLLEAQGQSLYGGTNRVPEISTVTTFLFEGTDHTQVRQGMCLV